MLKYRFCHPRAVLLLSQSGAFARLKRCSCLSKVPLSPLKKRCFRHNLPAISLFIFPTTKLLKILEFSKIIPSEKVPFPLVFFLAHPQLFERQGYTIISSVKEYGIIKLGHKILMLCVSENVDMWTCGQTLFFKNRQRMLKRGLLYIIIYINIYYNI